MCCAQAAKEDELLEMRREASRRQLEAAKKEREAAQAKQSALAEKAAAEKQAQARVYKERMERLKATWKDDKATSKARAACNCRHRGMSTGSGGSRSSLRKQAQKVPQAHPEGQTGHQQGARRLLQ